MPNLAPSFVPLKNEQEKHLLATEDPIIRFGLVNKFWSLRYSCLE